ncbi:hypothetical protein BDR03DRAFT_1018229 [Suillus americanus]|nr:hypothetical protein BDR03DRAFT_1018229 [Suillus americanus]
MLLPSFLPYGVTVCMVASFLSQFYGLEHTESFATPSFDIPDGLPPSPHGMTSFTTPSFDISDGLPPSPWLGVSNGLLHHPHGIVVCTVMYIFTLKPLAERFVLPRGASALQNHITVMTAAWFFPFSI